jgi:hypothetical protein
MPFADTTPVPGLQHVVVSAEGTKGATVVLGTISPPSSADLKEQAGSEGGIPRH